MCPECGMIFALATLFGYFRMLDQNSLVVAGVGSALGLYLLRRHFKGGQFRERVSAKGKVAVVTGCNSGIGLETARELNIRGAKVYMLCRSEERAREAQITLVKKGCDATRLIYVNCDLSSKSNVRTCAQKLNELESHIDILINNAGLWLGGFEKTNDGHEMTWQTNHLGPFLLTELLLPLVEKAESGRIINVASALHKKSPVIDLSSIDSVQGFGSAYIAYNKTKLANVMHARELSRRLRAKGNTTVTVNSLHPGVIASELWRNFGTGMKLAQLIGGFMLKSEKDGAQTSLYLALSNEVKGVSGCYFMDCARKPEAPQALDDLACKQLYDYSLKAVGLDSSPKI